MTHSIPLTQILGSSDAKWGMVSLPIPQDNRYTVQIEGTDSQAVPVGFWPRSEDSPGGFRKPRRSLVFFDRSRACPNVIAHISEDTCVGVREDGKWKVEVRVVEKYSDRQTDTHWCYHREDCEVALAFGDHETVLRLGNQNDFGLHWWQYVVAEPIWKGPLCEAWRIGGHIYVGDERRITKEELNATGGLTVYPDDTEAASVYAVLFNDGTIQITAHWINGRIYGGYGNHKGIPIVAFLAKNGTNRVWTGSDGLVQIGQAVCDFGPAAHLVSQDHPGEFRSVDTLQIWQPFENTLITLRHMGKDGEVTTIELADSEQGLFQGVARSVTWNMKLGQGAPSIARYLAPREWYAANCEFSPFALQPADGEFTRLSELAAEALCRNQVRGCFTSGAIYRYLDNYGKGVTELSMDANECRSLFRRAYWDHVPAYYDLALRNAYFCADVATDHSRDLIHYHGDKYPWRTYSLIYMRFSGITYGYLETGDPYLLETAEAVARNYMSQHLQNWPRKGIGRDADPLTGFLILWEYTGKEEYFEFAKTFAKHVTEVIGDGGEWLSGSGVGPLMGCNAEIGSTWNGGHFLSGFTEYAMRDPHVPKDWLDSAERALKRLYSMLLEQPGGFHPASTGFVGRIHWYLACRVGNEELMNQTHELMRNLLAREHANDEVLFSGGRAHHMNNYVDNLLFYQSTKETLPSLLAAGGKEAYPLISVLPR